jgi:phosphatidylserine/phosphatidylglycerophosphate/cardiolipin synthase-like enzyme
MKGQGQQEEINRWFPSTPCEWLQGADVDKAIAKHLKITRILKGSGQALSHHKLLCVDEQALYIGSDNAYPSYNEEHGVWIDDKDTIAAWKKDCWNPLWALSESK